MKLAKPSLILLLLLGSVVAHAAPGTQPPASQAGAVSSDESFKNGDTVCWVGDSITYGGSYHADIQLFYVTRFPDREITYYNCGIGGDRASNMMHKAPTYRFKHDILSHKPTVTAIMLGMNDVDRGAYKPQGGLEELKVAALADYDKNMQLMIQELHASRSRVILIQPSIYDETVVLSPDNTIIAPGVNAALGICAAKMKEWSAKYHTGLVDCYNRMNAINTAEQKKDPAFTIVGKDRIHPGKLGDFVMAYSFLKDTGMTPWVSKMTIDGASGSALESSNCTISKMSAAPGKVAFECLEGSLPFPTSSAADKALDLVPFTKDLNQELLTVTKLPAGKWSLTIDGQACGDFSSEQLSGGVNLATITSTPQYQQAAAVGKINVQRMTLAARGERSLVRVEYGFALGLNDPAADLDKVRAEIQKKVDEQTAKDPQKVSGELKQILDTAARKAGIAKEHEYAVAMRTAAKPKPHTYVLTPASGGK